MARLKTKSGTRVTKAFTERLAKEAEEGYDLSRARRERVQGAGRPSLENGVSPRITYRVGRGLYARVKQRADAEGRSVSAIARDALERYIAGG